MTTRLQPALELMATNAIRDEEYPGRAGHQSEEEPSSSPHLDCQRHVTGFQQTSHEGN
ncbi:hypothetical protein [Synechococcus sp. WH 8020]|uniref:hypothetical protein n=1 Tax=Synechococcus sp. (strain WH8020) TaxID=32052 RepID=UPI001FE17CA8|nr:hypothetical protein [Synechococcus sp. WH 8020]